MLDLCECIRGKEDQMEENEKDDRVGAAGFLYFINNFQIASYL